MKKKYYGKKIEQKFRGVRSLKNPQKKIKKDKPIITIITVTYNCGNLIEQTIKSVKGLNYDNLEYIIIDGKSIDQTLDIIKKYNNFIDFWISQKDRGIYNAMNKGIKYASGDAIFFLNAGDKLRSKEFINLTKYYNKNKKLYGDNFVLCGTTIYTKGYPGFPFLKENFIPFLGRLPSHQSMLIPRKLQLKNMYDERFPVSSDKDFKLKIFLKKVKFINKKFIVCLSLPDGKSQNIKNHLNLRARTNEIFNIFKKNYNFLWAFIYSLIFYLWNVRKIINKN